MEELVDGQIVIVWIIEDLNLGGIYFEASGLLFG
jgi:hypothetical protein